MIDYIKILKIIRNKAYTIHPQTSSNMKNNNT